MSVDEAPTQLHPCSRPCASGTDHGSRRHAVRLMEQLPCPWPRRALASTMGTMSVDKDREPDRDDPALAVPCPRCSARVRELCRTSERLPRRTHRRRTAAYLQTLTAAPADN
ncbi:zinc finger domain-containing protein [Cellulomonas sp. NS3]|uniref:zinc finger domain-containing protein n=1 Tax=Cellulomonas sp. NS3 TaxID=2973977 RepID=UPI003CC8302D